MGPTIYIMERSYVDLRQFDADGEQISSEFHSFYTRRPERKTNDGISQRHLVDEYSPTNSAAPTPLHSLEDSSYQGESFGYHSLDSGLSVGLSPPAFSSSLRHCIRPETAATTTTVPYTSDFHSSIDRLSTIVSNGSALSTAEEFWNTPGSDSTTSPEKSSYSNSDKKVSHTYSAGNHSNYSGTSQRNDVDTLYRNNNCTVTGRWHRDRYKDSKMSTSGVPFITTLGCPASGLTHIPISVSDVDVELDLPGSSFGSACLSPPLAQGLSASSSSLNRLCVPGQGLSHSAPGSPRERKLSLPSSLHQRRPSLSGYAAAAEHARENARLRKLSSVGASMSHRLARVLI
ncbi:hypothetical protein BIW11_13243 [Tropilaelaps mercedesae]|uniref:Uncharacterized protein n=1 Tax=Tropilaelaps mercedesae TaxID=418985 RepID=A0A1V9X2T8_9ACAR|nr:hypothetical protein BIW11_13243 [Tropilaelaps mercedesae]